MTVHEVDRSSGQLRLGGMADTLAMSAGGSPARRDRY
jgi:hypothetical protein